MMKINILIFALCTYLGICVGQYVQSGQCDSSIKLVDSFDIEKFTGVWYELQRTSSPEQKSHCSYFEISISSNDSDSNDSNGVNSDIDFTSDLDNRTINVYYKGVNNNFLEEAMGFATLEHNTSRLVLNTTLFDEPQDFWILMTDYNNFAVAYSCENVSPTQRSIHIWVLGRTSQYPTEMVPPLIATNLEELFDIDLNLLPVIDHTEMACYELPVIPPGESIILSGQCDENIQVEQAFNVEAFTGVWHQIYSYYTENSIGTCVRAEYSLGDGVVDVLNSQVINQTLFTITGNASVASTDNSAKLKVILNTAPGVTVEQDLWIISTDYFGYAISYSCENLANNQKRIYSWILSRSRQLSNETETRVNQVIDSIIELNTVYYLPTSHSSEDCFFFPEPSDKPVVFRGQCDEEIPAIMPFDPTAYMGLWHNIELYPTIFQDGTCGNAFYELIDGVVYVYNTQVVNETLDTIRGTAVIASTDGSAKLLVSFPIAGTNLTTSTPYWVLDTDYENYALVYSCSNINDDEMQVSSWKLSRTKELSTNHSNIIDGVMRDIPVLDQRYFKTEGQKEEDCFFYPTPEPGVPVVFPGRCESNIAMQNFDLTRFIGTWYEVEAYPKDEQTGQCIRHTYTSVSNSQLNFVTASVTDQFLSESNGILSTTGVTGELTITIVSDGQIITIPFWVIDTNYNEYALAYACVERPNDFRAVYSWKLSRTKELSLSSQIAIATASSNIVVLNEQYYETIDQSDDACFYLPEIEPGQPIILPGSCDSSIRVEQNFDAGEFIGVWHQIYSYYTESSTGTCVRAEYSIGDGVVDVLNSQVINQTLFTITGNASVASTDNSGKLNVILNIAPGVTVEQELWILSTDYKGYAISYSCENLENNQKRIYSWILSRTRELSNESEIQVNEVINSIRELNTRYFLPTSHSSEDCFFFPEPSDKPVVFRGQCDEEIPALVPFDPTAYMGLWHNIELYPAIFQDGTCGNAFYELIDGVVYVYNTQVVNETLDTIRGTAVIASTDGSAKLLVTFPIAGTNLTTSTPYWVLDTDYNNYALVYSCSNINDDEMQVSSWKLSRTKELSTNHSNIIDGVMRDIPVLDQRYFKTEGQTEEDCFFYPTPEPGVPVVFPGRCESNIAMQNFDLTRFIGTWYEVEAYPKDEQTGQCIRHTYTSVSNSQLNFVTSSVNNESLSESNGILSTTSVTGELTITIVSDGQLITIPFWVIDTNYDDYALAYACVERPNDFRAVYSWKLSRTRELSPAGNNAINSAMNNIDVLENKYFESIGQTDDECFYLPELGPTDPVTFPGQCDPNIQAISDFDAGRYLGRWRLIETYYTDFQLGTCNEATYSPADDGSVIVYNTEVVNQQLESITGSAVLASTDGTGKLLVSFPTTTVQSEYWILDTDYESYALVYSCQNIEANRRRVWSWKMSRFNNLTEDATAAINKKVESINVLNDRYYQEVDRSDDGCFYYPTPDPNTPVIFRGQCNMSIPAVPEFDAGRYLGFWYDIQSYPAPFQTGTCNNANYTLNDDGSVRVENTQVVDQLLEVWIGRAVVDSDDGSAKLSVTFNVNGQDVTSKYWVLETDYENYALVYSCQNIDDERRSVFSWKLSRSPSLTPQMLADIDAKMATVEVLDQRYFVTRNHTEEDCFYYPDNNGGDVLLRGQCIDDASVPVVDNFNIDSFVGTWHEVARFPSDLQNGECVATDSVNNNNIISIKQTNVVNERLVTTTSQATVSDNRGIITLNIDGVPFNNIYILGVDYNDYALAYSCRNVTDEWKQIYSWKLSRTRAGLSNAANNAINQLVSENIDLWEGYYRSTGQDNDACFYYPIFDTIPSFIELPGYCPDIRGVDNFNAEAYLGRWFEIQRYPVTAQIGQCNRAEYSLSENGRVFVSNTEVNEETLLTQIGYADIASTDGSGQLNVEFVVDGELLTANYYIIATDYYNYSLVYSCMNLENGNSAVSSWKLSRSLSLSPESSEAIDIAVGNTRGLTEEFYLFTSQSNDDCFYIPEVGTEAPLFRGQCEDISGVQEFDIQRYLGWWHEIESYPVDGTTGECRNSDYSQVGNTYQVVENSVLDNNGTYVVGTITVMENGRLIKRVSGRPDQDIWILATDYDSYALLYSCENVGVEYRRVWSAKHSRTRSLSAQAQSAMAPVIANNRVLRSQFYLPVNQTNDVCFHYPMITSGPIIIPGQCDPNIPAVQSFAVDNFTGTWFHIERYDDLGTNYCLGSTYTVDDANGNITVLNFEVNNSEELETVEGSAVVQSTDGSARAIVLTLPEDGSEDATVSTVVTIVATDYINYGLVYNCRNVNSYQRQVRAWILSRERTMSAVGTAAINAFITQREEFHQLYFKKIHQHENCTTPSSAFLVKSSVLLLLVGAIFQWLL